MKLIYPAVFYPLEENPGYLVEVPDLPGCTTQGNSLENAIEMAVDAASGYVLDSLEDGEPIPKASNIKSIKPDSDDGFVNLIVLDMDAYSEKYGNKSVRKNCTIPAWLNTIAEEKHINFSSVLQSALINQLNL